MANALKHKKISEVADGPSETRVKPSHWNDEHVFAGGTTAGDSLVWKGSESDNVTFAPILLPGARLAMDLDTAPLGWTRDTDDETVDDRLMRIVSGARVHGGDWQITGLGVVAHTHTMKDHKHETPVAQGDGTFQIKIVTAGSWPHGTSGTVRGAEGEGRDGSTSGVTLMSGPPNDNTTGETAAPVVSDGTWRPEHRDFILCQKDGI